MCRSGLHCCSVTRLCWKRSHSVFVKTLNFPLFWTSFLAFTFPVTCVLFMCGRSFPETLEEASPTWSKSPRIKYIKKRMFSFIFMTLTGVVVLYTSLRLVEGVYKPQRDCFGWWFACVMNEPVSQNRVSTGACLVNQTYLFGQKFPLCHPIRRRNKIPG